MGTYKVTVSSLEIRKEPPITSRLTIKRDTIVKTTEDKPRQYKKEIWVKVETITEPVVSGYVLKKYLSRI